MIHIDLDSKNAANCFAKAREEKPWVTKVPRASNTYRVVPRTPEHGKYIVRVEIDEGELYSSCIDARTGEDCPSKQTRDRICYHQMSVVLHIESRVRTRELRAA